MSEKIITVIIPVHTLEGNYTEMLENAISSIEDFHNDVKVSIVCPVSLMGELDKLTLSQKLEINYNSHTSETDFCSQINKGAESCKTEWFTILEVDDEFKPVWLKSMNEYLNEFKDVDVFLSIVKDINTEGKFMSFTNESTWAYGFTEFQGVLDNEALLEFQNYQTSGGLYRTKVFIDNGGFKNNIKLTFSYELLLRLTHNGVKVMTVPKVGYQHVNFREDSLFWNYKNDDLTKLSENEGKFWLETAKREFFFKNKRDVTFNEA
jgi:hypothetical protein